MENKRIHLTFRLILLGLILLSMGVAAFAISELVIYHPEDFVFSVIVTSIGMAFAVFEVIMTLKNIKKKLAIYRIGFTDRGYINPIPLIAIAIGILIGLTMSLLGVILFCIRDEIIIKCNSLVILSLGFYLLVNCVFYIAFILFMKNRADTAK